MSQSSLAEFIENECVPRLTATAVYRELRSNGRQQPYLRGACPFAAGKSRAGSFLVDPKTLRWSCLDHCHRGGQSVLAYLNGGQFPRPGTRELEVAVEKAARLAEIPRKNVPPITPSSQKDLAHRERVASLLETFFIHARRLLHSSPVSMRKPTEAFMARHGFAADSLETIPVGLVPDVAAMQRGLEHAGYTAQEIAASQLCADDRLAGRLIGPIRDRHGLILSFWARDPSGRPPKFLFKGPWKAETALAGLDVAFAATGNGCDCLEDLLVFERLFDALVVQGLGFPLAAAIGGPASDMTRSRWERLASLGVRRVTLAPDPSTASNHAILTAVDSALAAKAAPIVWVLLPGEFSQCATPVELARFHGLPGLQAALQTRVVHAYHYKALAILKKHRPAAGWNDPARHVAWKEAIEFYARSDPKHDSDLNLHFVPAIVAGLERSWESFEPSVSPPPESADPEPSPPRPAILPPPTVQVVADDTTSTMVLPATPASSNGHHSIFRKRVSRNGSNGYCRIHHCDTTICFCFD